MIGDRTSNPGYKNPRRQSYTFIIDCIDGSSMELFVSYYDKKIDLKFSKLI